MKAAIINNLAGSYGTISNTAIWDKATKYGLTRLYLDARYAAPGDIDYIHSKAREAGVYRDPGWDGSPDAGTFASEASADITRLNATSKQLAYLFDIETHNTLWIREFIAAWRSLRPTRSTQETFEPIQGGVEPLDAMESANITEEPQEYFGDMTPVAGDRIVIDLVEWGADIHHIEAVYDGAHLPADWDGTVFTLERLP